MAPISALTKGQHADEVLRDDLRAALRTRELFTLFQPVVALETGTMASAEALLRWPHARLGMVPPARFVGVADRAGLIGSLSRYVLSQAAAQATWWNRHTPGDPLVVSVNMPASLLAVTGQIDAVEQVVVGADAEPDLVMIELTGCPDRDRDETRHTVTALRNRGFHVAVDDVRDCVATDARPSDVHVDAVKIDRDLVERIATLDRPRRTVARIIERAHEAGVTVVAKGVDGQRHLDVLTDLGCDQVQGFGVTPPGTARQVAEQRWRELEQRLRSDTRTVAR